jgi:hypothetical protein
MKADYVALVDLILSRGHRVDVYTGDDEPDVSLSSNRADILMAIESVDCAELRVYANAHGGNEKLIFQFWAMIIPFGVAPDETVADYTDNGYWTEEFV